MFLLAYRSSKHETTGVTPAELYFARDLRLPLDLLHSNPTEQKMSFHSSEDYVRDLAKRLEVIHSGVRERIQGKSLKMKAWYDQKTRQIQFQEGQKVWLYNPRKVKGKAPKLQCN